MDTKGPLSPSPTPSVKSYPSYHLLSTFVFVAWSLFTAATVIVHELAHRKTWDPARILAGDGIPWAYRPGSGLPSILRTGFAQFHGAITAMHLARLAVTALDVSWSSPKTWMELFWLADRRWSGPIGLAKTSWTLMKSWRRMSLSFLLLATISVLALATPVVMTRAYPVVTGHAVHSITATNVSVFDLSAATDDSLAGAQATFAYSLWGKGMSATELYPRNAYAEVGVQSTDASGAWFFTGDSQKSEITVSGIRVAGGCEAWQTYIGPTAFLDRCKAELRAELNPDNAVTRGIAYGNGQVLGYALITNASSCSDIGQTTPFGREVQSTALFRMWFESGGEPDLVEKIVRCNATAGPGTAYVDGANMTFSQFVYAAPDYTTTTLSQSSIPLDPIAAITLSDMLPFQQSVSFKRTNTKINDNEVSREEAMAAAMWDGVVAMSAELWLESSRRVDQPGIQRLVTTGIRRDENAFLALIALLGLWFVGMIGATAALLRSTWASTLDGYAVARMLRYQPLPAGTPWFADLEDNEDMLKQFEMHEWRSSEE